MCDYCNDTGLVYERREGTDYPYTCKVCERYNPFDLSLNLREMARNRDVPIVHSE